MSVRKRSWRDKQGRAHEKWMIHIEHTWPDGRKQSIRKVSPVQTKRGAEQYERELRKQLVSGQWEEDGKQRDKTPTLEGFVEEFIAYQATLNKATVIMNKRAVLRQHLLPAFGRHRLDQIDERSIDAYKVDKLGAGLAPQTVNLHLKLLGRMLRVARKWKLLRDVPEIGLLKGRKVGFDFLDFEESELFLAAAAKHRPAWHPYMVVALRTGLRVGEMVALRWREDIDLERGRLRVQQSYSRLGEFTSPKNDRARELPLSWDAIEALRTQQARSTGELVFPGNEGVLDDRATNYAIEKICEQAGLRRLHNHVLRHTFASHAVMRGVPIRQVQEWMGHTSIVVTMRYAHLAEGHGDELIQRLAPTKPAGQLKAKLGPAPGTGEQAKPDAARSQHMGSPETSKRHETPVLPA